MEGEHPANRYPLGVTFCRVATAQQAEAAECTSATPSKAVVTGYAAAYGRQHARRFQDERWYDLIVILDDATSEIYYARLVEEEGTRTVLAALREVIETRGVFCALYSDRGEPFFVNPKAREPVDKARLTQVGRALRELGIQMIPAYSPQARGRMERSYRTWQGRLPQELRIRGLKTAETANAFLCAEYIGEFNRRFAVAAEGKGSAFIKTRLALVRWKAVRFDPFRDCGCLSKLESSDT